MGFQVAIDGPSGSGKSSVARQVASAHNFIYLDTGAMYRAVGLFFLNHKIEPHHVEKIQEHLLNNHIQIDLKYVDGLQKVFLNKRDVTLLLRDQSVAKAASDFGSNPTVRDFLTNVQRKIAGDLNIVMDGRDIGSVVLPKADLKIYLDASVESRVQRRCGELKKLQKEYEERIVREEIINRDYQDMNREFSPLIKADDAILIDSSNMSLEEVVKVVLELIEKTGKMKQLELGI